MSARVLTCGQQIICSLALHSYCRFGLTVPGRFKHSVCGRHFLGLPADSDPLWSQNRSLRCREDKMRDLAAAR